MSDDHTKDLTFNQRYAGRSRVRRDLNTLKYVIKASPGTTSGVTRYNIGQHVGMTMQAAIVNFGPQYGTTIGTGPLASSTFASFSGHAQNNWCLWRGPRDSSYGAPDALATKSTCVIHKVNMLVSQNFNDGSGGAGAAVTVTVGNGGGNAIYHDATGYIDGTPRLDNAIPDTMFLPSSASNAGDITKWGVFAGFVDNDERNQLTLDGIAPANAHVTSTTSTFTFDGGTGNANFQHGIWLRMTCSGSARPSTLVAGGLKLFIFYTLFAE